MLGTARLASPRGVDVHPEVRTERGEAAFGSLPEDAFPEMRRVAPLLATHPTDANFHTGLGWLLDGMVSESGG